MATKTNIGDQLHLWMPTAASDTVVISCHGGVLSSTFTMPNGSSFFFFSPPMRSAAGHLSHTVHDDMVKETKRFDPTHGALHNQIDDYQLSKFQGSHGQNSESYDQVMSFVDEYGQNVLTVRNRKAWFGVDKDEAGRRLSSIVTQISVQHPHIHNFRCMFCRT